MHVIVEGLDRVGKDTLISELQHRLGYRLVLHYQKPVALRVYADRFGSDALREYQRASFRTMLSILRDEERQVICNRSHLGEFVYAPLYRKYDGGYVFELEREYQVAKWQHVRVVLLVEDLASSTHFSDDGKSLGDATSRSEEQDLFLDALSKSSFADKRTVCVTDTSSGGFRPASEIANEVMAPSFE